MSFLELKIPPPAVGLSLAIVMWLLAGVLPGLSFANPWQFWLALLFAFIGVCFDLAGLIAFRVAKTTINPLKPGKSSALVVSGVYRMTRNPMYVGMLFILTGWAIYQSNFAAVLVVPLFVLFISRYQIIPEERILTELFGAEFESYKKSVRRWL